MSSETNSQENNTSVIATTQTVEFHPEWSLQNALTSPSDKDKTAATAINRDTLNETQSTQAVKELVVKDFLSKFPRYDRLYADPTIPNQTVCLHSFVPSKGATPDKDGVYGMIKVRGIFATEQEADQRSEFLIKNNDSYHKIYQSYVGRPIPLSHNSKYVSDTKEIDLTNKVTKVMAEDVKEKKQKEKVAIDEIKERERQLLKDNSKRLSELENKDSKEPAPVNPEDLEVDEEEKYTTLRVKKAQLLWTYFEHSKKMEELKTLIKKSSQEIEVMDAQNDNLKKVYFDKYKKAREDVNIPVDDNSFIKYMVEDVKLDF